MARITALQAAFRGSRRRVVFLDDQEWRATSLAVIKALGLAVGDDVDVSGLADAIAEAESTAVRERALALLGYREHGSAELTTKLTADGYPLELARSVVASFVRVELIDDQRYAAMLARTLLESRGYGRMRARREMTRRGLEEDRVDGALDACESSDDERDRAMTLAVRWARPGMDTRRLAARLARRGFPVRTCFDAAKTALECHEEVPPDEAL